MAGAWAILQRHLTVFRRTWWSNVTFNFIEPFLYLSAMGLGLGAYVDEIEGMSYIQFIAPGMVASSSMWAATFECTYSTFIRMSFQKTFHAMLAGPVTVRDIVVGEVLFGALKSVVFGSIILIVIGLWGQVQSAWALLIPLFLALPGMVFSLMAITYTGLTPHIDYLNYYITLFITPLYLFGGIFFPIASLPGWVQAVAWLNPIYHSAEVCRALAIGRMDTLIGWHVLVLVGLILVFAYPPIRILTKRLID